MPWVRVWLTTLLALSSLTAAADETVVVPELNGTCTHWVQRLTVSRSERGVFGSSDDGVPSPGRRWKSAERITVVWDVSVVGRGDAGVVLDATLLEDTRDGGSLIRHGGLYGGLGVGPADLLAPRELLDPVQLLPAERIADERFGIQPQGRRRHALGEAHRFTVSADDHDESASCGGLGTITGDSLRGTITVLDGAGLIASADLVETLSVEQDRFFQQDLEDGGILTLRSNSDTTTRLRWQLAIECNRRPAP